LKGYERAEIIGKHFSTFYPRSDIDAEKPQFELRMAREIGRYEDEGWRMRKDGSRFWANVVITPLIGSDGRLTGYAKVTRDLTQRKLQEESFQRLLESEERFRLLVEQVKDYAIFMLDPRGHVTSWNQGARRLKGYTADEIIGKHFSTFYTQEDLASDKPARELIIAVRDGVYEEEGWRLRKDGTRFWASVVITALWDKRGNLTGFAKVTRDLTQKKKEQEMLRQRTEELEAFAHTLSHDLRAPLRSISSFAHILRSERNDLAPEEQDTYLDKVLAAAQAMETLVSDVLKLSHLSLAPIVEESVSLADLLREVLDIFEVEIRERGAHLSIGENLPHVRANRTLLVQIFSNLIANALKFSKPGEPPRIEIYPGNDPEECTIHVKDHGVGIPKQYQQSIFKLFERGNAGPKHGGTGIGLAIVKKAAERLGGTISLASEEDQGSDFILALPCETSRAVSPSDAIAEDAVQLIH
jgi:PAS domain S-box-containing protein